MQDENDDPLMPHVPPDEEITIPGAYEGDMMLTPDQIAALLSNGGTGDDDDDESRRVKRKATTNLVKRWPQNTIPYVITDTSRK